jgi:hypothetical protein
VAHPQLKDARDGHDAKLKRMTQDYGSASGPANNIPAPTNKLKGEGPEDDVGFGAESDMPRARADRASRRKAPQANPVATFKRGGAVKKRAEGGDVSAIEEANRDQAAANRAHGGRTKHKGSTHVNVIVAPQGGAGAGPGVPPMPMPHPVIAPPGPPGMPPGAPPAMPPRPPMGGMPPGGGMPMAAGAPGGIPPGMIPPRAKGGRVHADKAQDEALIKKTLRDEGLKAADKPEHAHCGRLQKHDMTAGAVSGVGRLEKIGDKPKDAGRPQTV